MKISDIHPNPLMPGSYRTDVFNNNPLFLVRNKNSNSKFFVRTWQEAYILGGKFPLMM